MRQRPLFDEPMAWPSPQIESIPVISAEGLAIEHVQHCPTSKMTGYSPALFRICEIVWQFAKLFVLLRPRSFYVQDALSI
jgi:hypothetical protein